MEIALTSDSGREDPTIWTNINKGVYSVVLTSPEIILIQDSPFLVPDRKRSFKWILHCCGRSTSSPGLARVQKRIFQHGQAQSILSEVPIMALSATITRNVLDYLHGALKLWLPTNLYKRTLDRTNITYMVQDIQQKGLGELNMPTSKTGGVGSIPKTMTFVDDINGGAAMAVHLRSLLPTSMRNKDEIARTFSSNVEANTREVLMRDFQNGNTRIWVCTDAAGVGIDIRDVARAIQ